MPIFSLFLVDNDEFAVHRFGLAVVSIKYKYSTKNFKLLQKYLFKKIRTIHSISVRISDRIGLRTYVRDLESKSPSLKCSR